MMMPRLASTDMLHGVLVMSALVWATTGCGLVTRLGSEYRVEPIITREAAQKLKQLGIEPIDIQTFKLHKDDSKAAYVLAAEDQSGAMRNRLQDRIMLVSNNVCEAHKSEIAAVGTGINLSLGGLTTMMAGAGAVVSGIAASALSAAAGATNASRALVNEELYQRAFVGAIVRTIENGRKEKAREIAGKRTRDGNLVPIASYSVDEAIKDAVEYHQLCSFYQGLAALARAGERPAPSRQELLQRTEALKHKIDTYEEKLKQITTDPKKEKEKKEEVEQIQRIIDGLWREIESLHAVRRTLGE